MRGRRLIALLAAATLTLLSSHIVSAGEGVGGVGVHNTTSSDGSITDLTTHTTSDKPSGDPAGPANSTPICVQSPGAGAALPSADAIGATGSLGQPITTPVAAGGPMCLDAITKPGIDQGLQWAIDQATRVAQRLQPGTVHFHPDPHQQLVNLPAQGYLVGAGVNGQPGALLAQRVTFGGYTFTFTTKVIEVDWTWGDGYTDHLYDAAGLGQDVMPPNGTSSVQHSYAKIGPYQVTVSETWAITATMIDPAGRIMAIPQVDHQFHPTTTATVDVGQFEGVPQTNHA
jgi:hypothetical protein